MFEYPKKLDKIFEKLKSNGIRAIIVGGFVRDSFLGKKSKDIDIELYNVTSFEKIEEILQEFSHVNSVGKSFGVCKMMYEDLDLDFTLPREDNKVSNGHRGFDVKVKTGMDYKKACSRRDFTINTIGFDVEKKEILDPFNGLQDLENRLLRVVDKKSFIEDPLRVLRGVQFSARFNLHVDNELFELCSKMIKEGMLDELSKNRVFQELKKLFLKAKKPSLGVELLKSFGGFEYFKELKNIQDKEYESVLYALDNLAKIKLEDKDKIVLMLSVFCCSFKDDIELFSRNFVQSLSDESELLDRVGALVKSYFAFEKIALQDMDNYFVYKLATKTKIKDLILLQKAFSYVENKKINKLETKAKQLHVQDKKMPPFLMGRDIIELGLNPSKEFSTILHVAYEEQMKESFSYYDEAKIWLKNFLK